ncbi:hypothetical protein C7W88_14920 [Novosphingobium sp. THN1]|uniref:hypothetical protein n=1 Tax=Novosphingobium sp. THN1 TaxID=1016987 RepID=UPI000E4A1134|nr:hypothetical protein [Novosphingobium sp. THN1]AXU20042.1 hypothetical protein C7W88_14920 [Novosphingobium sp. THN1]
MGSQVGDGASGIGGTATFTITDGTFAASTLVVSATGEGGNGQNTAGGGRVPVASVSVVRPR